MVVGQVLQARKQLQGRPKGSILVGCAWISGWDVGQWVGGTQEGMLKVSHHRGLRLEGWGRWGGLRGEHREWAGKREEGGGEGVVGLFSVQLFVDTSVRGGRAWGVTVTATVTGGVEFIQPIIHCCEQLECVCVGA